MTGVRDRRTSNYTGCWLSYANGETGAYLD